MLRTLRVTSLVLITMLVWSQPANADWWDFFAELSGPGPFHGRGHWPENVMATIYCHGVSSGSGWVRLLDKAEARGPCFFADLRNFEAPNDDKFFRTRATVTEIGPTYRLAPPIEVGIGVGVIHFNSTSRTADRFTLSFPRVVLKPILLVPSWQESRKGNWGFFQIYFRETRILGELNGKDDFRAASTRPFQARNDMVASTGFLIDVVGLTRLILNK